MIVHLWWEYIPNPCHFRVFTSQGRGMAVTPQIDNQHADARACIMEGQWRVSIVQHLAMQMHHPITSIAVMHTPEHMPHTIDDRFKAIVELKIHCLGLGD